MRMNFYSGNLRRNQPETIADKNPAPISTVGRPVFGKVVISPGALFNNLEYADPVATFVSVFLTGEALVPKTILFEDALGAGVADCVCETFCFFGGCWFRNLPLKIR